MSRDSLAKLFTLAMFIAGIGLASYFTIYVWRRVGRPQVRDNGEYVPHTTEDYAYYYAAARAMTLGQDIYTAEAPGRTRAGYIYPPMLAFLYQPLARLDLPDGARVALVIDVLAIAGALAMAARTMLRRFGADARWPCVLTVAVCAALLSTDKIKGELQMVQCNGIVAFSIAAGLLLLDRKPFWAASALAFAINIKYQALALVLYLVFRRRWKPLGYTGIWMAFWSLLPALSIGLPRTLDYLARGFSGVLRMMGVNIAGDLANFEPLSGGYSISLTSAAARFVDYTGLHASPYLFAGMVMLAWLAALLLICRSQKVPPFAWGNRWPSARAQAAAPWTGIVAVEWVAVVASVLAFSPATNSRHLLQTLFIAVLGVVLVIVTRGKRRGLAIAALALLWIGLNLPPSQRVGNTVSAPVQFWRDISGPAWLLLISTGMLTWVGMGAASAPPPAPVPAPLDSGVIPPAIAPA